MNAYLVGVVSAETDCRSKDEKLLLRGRIPGVLGKKPARGTTLPMLPGAFISCIVVPSSSLAGFFPGIGTEGVEAVMTTIGGC
jgi:hypothetical protein